MYSNSKSAFNVDSRVAQCRQSVCEMNLDTEAVRMCVLVLHIQTLQYPSQVGQYNASTM